MLEFLTNRLRPREVNACFCTLAIRAPYRSRARELFADTPQLSWIVLTDQPEDFEGMAVRAIRHLPTGPMAEEFLTKLSWTPNGKGRPAYHDKRFALQAALKEFETA